MLGRWHKLPESAAPQDPLEEVERNRDRVRILLDRYGILFRELLARELPGFRWGSIFRALLLMELSGEVLTGRFFEGIPGPQFLAPGALRLFQEGLAEDTLYWLHAQDPASLCGVDLPHLKEALPRRLSGTHLVFLGPRLALVSRRRGRDLEIRLDQDHPALLRCFDFLAVQLTRRFSPRRHIEVETINDTPAPESPYLQSLAERFHVTSGATSARLWRRY
jgi:ATP-dependent Lhr-like helicase